MAERGDEVLTKTPARRRRLEDLYVVGKVVEFNDGAVDDEWNPLPPVQVYVRKLNRIENDKALRAANGARSALQARVREEGNDSLAKDYDRNATIEFLTQDYHVNRLPVVQAELSGDEDSEWSKDSYYEGLLEAWNAGLNDKYAADPEDEEAKKVFDEIQRFADEVDEKMKDLLHDKRNELDSYSDFDLRAKVTDRLLEMQSMAAWIYEYYRQQVFLAVREPDKVTPYFENVENVDFLTDEMYDALKNAYDELALPPVEGKD